MMILKRWILAACFLFFVSGYFMGDVHAADGQINLKNYTWYSSTGGIANYKNVSKSVLYDPSILMDDNTSTFTHMAGYGGTNVLWTTFDTPVDIDSYQAIAVPNVSIPQLILTLYDLSDNIIYKSSNLLTGSNYGKIIPVNLKNVTGITISIGVSNDKNYADLQELKLFGDAKIIIPDPPEKFVVNDVSFLKLSEKSFAVNWSPVESEQVRKYNVYLDGVLMGESTNFNFAFDKLDNTKAYKVKIGVVDFLGTEHFSEFTYEFPPPDLTPPDKPKGLKVTPDIYTASIEWAKGSEDDLAGYDLYLDDKKVNNGLIVANSYLIKSLQPDTTYKVYIVASDTSGNRSDPSDPVEFKTKSILSPPVDTPALTGMVGNTTASLSWTAVQYAESYDVYQDGEKIVETPATRINLKRLENGRSYEFHVVAKNDIGASPPSNVLKLIPNEKMIPPVQMDYGLKDIAYGTSQWFGSIWYILAFVISIPLAFYIANRVKGIVIT